MTDKAKPGHATPESDRRKEKKRAKAQWPDPEPLHGELRPVSELRVEMIPEPLRRWVVDVARRMQCPLDFVAVSTLCMVGGVIGAGCSIRPKRRDNWAVVPNLWGAVIARPGKKKSPAIDGAFKPLRQLESAAREDHEAKSAMHEAATAAFEAQRKAVRGDMEKAARKGEAEKLTELAELLASLTPPQRPPRRRYMTSDTTIEKAAELMKENPRGIVIVRDELIGLLVQWDRDDRREDRSFHLQGWSGDGGFTADRIGRGTIDTPQLCESIFGGIQPSKLLGYLAQTVNNIENDGMLQRFQLAVYPDELPGGPEVVDEHPDNNAKARVFMIIEELARMDFIKHGAETEEYVKIPFFRFGPEAQEFFFEWYLGLEAKRRNEGENIMVEHLSKFDSLMPSLALIFHLVDIADWQAHNFLGPQGHLFPEPPKQISLHNAQRAAEWCGYLEEHARRIYGLAADLAVQGARKILEKIRDGVLEDGFTARDIYRQAWSLLGTRELVFDAIEELLEAGWLREVQANPGEQGGRPPAPTYRIHPKAREILQKEEK